MTRPSGREASDWPLVRWTVGGLGIIAVMMVTGCSLAIARSGVSGLSELPEQGVTRKEIHDRFGQPDSSAFCDGRHIDVHTIRYKVPWPYGYRTRSTDPVHAFFLETFTLGLIDPFLIAEVMVDKERTAVHFAFVYDASHVLVSRVPVAKNTDAPATCATQGTAR